MLMEATLKFVDNKVHVPWGIEEAAFVPIFAFQQTNLTLAKKTNFLSIKFPH